MLLTILGIIALLLIAAAVYRTYFALQKPIDSDYWVRLKELSYGFDFEMAPELMPFPVEDLSDSRAMDNSIQIIPEQDFFLVGWKLDQSILTEDNRTDAPQLILRIYESSEMLRHHDIKVNKAEGGCRLHLQAHRAYYAAIGCMEKNRFYPLAFSNTIIPNSNRS